MFDRLVRLAFVASMLAAVSPRCAADVEVRRIAFSFDDAPQSDGALLTGAERTRTLLRALEEGGIPQAAFFVTTSKLRTPDDAQRLRDYVAAGHVLANHSHEHLGLSDTPVDAYVDDVAHAQQALSGFDGTRPWFRYPFLDEGRTAPVRDAARDGLARLGLANGYVTVDNYDWYLAGRIDAAVREARAVDRDALRGLYVDMLVDAAEFYDGIAREALGRSPAHVLLLHENDLAALYVDDLAAALRERGWRIVGADEAYSDAIATRVPDTLFNGQGRVAALAHAAGRPARELIHAAEDEAWIDAEIARRGIVGAPDR